MKVAVIGSRGLWVPNLADYLPADVTEIVSGGARGVDSAAAAFAREHGLKLTEFLPDYASFGRRAPLVRNITIIDYSDAPAEICQSLRKDLDRVTSLVEQFDLTGNKDISDNDKTQCYACTSNIDDGKISDFIIVIEEDKSKTIMYMEGDLVVK
jgi:predicted RecB family endonuclease